jgi:hypothetical protein
MSDSFEVKLSSLANDISMNFEISLSAVTLAHNLLFIDKHINELNE